MQILRNAKFARANFAQRKICQGKFCVTQNLLGQILRNAKCARANFAYWPILGHLGAFVVPSWGHLGPILEPPWAILELSWVDFGPSWGYFTSTLWPADLSADFQKLVFR